MARLIVEAVSNEKHDMKLGILHIIVSVSRADDGSPVTGLTDRNFRLTNFGLEPKNVPDDNDDYKILLSERTWDPDDKEASGVYTLLIQHDFGKFLLGGLFQSGETFAFGLQVRVFYRGVLLDCGQTVISLTSLEQVEL